MNRAIVKITRKGQVTIPKFLRDLLDLHEGDLVYMEEKDGKIVISKADIPLPGVPVGVEKHKMIIDELEKVRKEWR